MSSLFQVLFALFLTFTVAFSAKNGVITFYDPTGSYACSFQDIRTPLMIAASSGSNLWNHAINCGRCVRINANGKSLTVRVVDRCDECPEGHFDLSRDAFSVLADPSVGRMSMTYEWVPCETSGNIVYRVKDRSTQYWMSILIDNHRVGVKKFEIKGQGMGKNDKIRRF